MFQQFLNTIPGKLLVGTSVNKFIQFSLLRQRSFVPVPYQLIQQIELNDLMSVLLAIDELHVIITDTELYAPGLSAILPHVDVYWHKISYQPITPANNNGSEQFGQTATTIFNHSTQKIVNKYHSDIDPKMKDNSVCLTSLAKVFKHKVTS